MKQKHLYIIGVLIGALLILLGALFLFIYDGKFSFLTMLFVSIGASLWATLLSNSILNFGYKNRLDELKDKFNNNSRVFNLALDSLFRGPSSLYRKNQTLRLTFSKSGDKIKIIGVHSFIIKNFGKNKLIGEKTNIYTDSGSWDSKGGNFESVMEPTDNILRDNALSEHTLEKDGKIHFDKEYDFDAESENRFKFRTYGYYRIIDRLIWTIQDISNGMTVTIINRTGIKFDDNVFKIKINHPNEKKIKQHKPWYDNQSDASQELQFSFNSTISPYQGFEIMWNLETPKSN